MIYLQLFLSYLKIGFFGFGGGYGDAVADSARGGDRPRLDHERGADRHHRRFADDARADLDQQRDLYRLRRDRAASGERS